MLKVLARRRLISSVTVFPGDTVIVDWHDGRSRTELVRHEITKSATYDEAVIAELEFEGRQALGGFIVEEKS